MNGFYLYIGRNLQTFVYSDVIPRVNETVEYDNKSYTVIDVKHCASQIKIIGDATILYKVKASCVYVTDK